MNLPSFSTGVSAISSGGMVGGGSGPATAFLIGPAIIWPATWAKAVEQTIDVPRTAPQIMDSLIDLTGGILFTPFSPRLTNESLRRATRRSNYPPLAEGTRSAHDKTYEITPPACGSRPGFYLPNRENVCFSVGAAF